MNGPEDRPSDQTPLSCAGPGCTEAFAPRPTGRPARYCSASCRCRAQRARQRARAPVSVEVDLGSASSRGRLPGRSWMVRLRRGPDSVIVAVGLSRPSADRLAAHITDLLKP